MNDEPADRPPQPDDEQWREFQEFKRFQEYLRYSQSTGATQQTPADDERTPPQGTEIQPYRPSAPVPHSAPAAQPWQGLAPQEQPDLQHQLGGMQRQLTELTDAQRTAQRAANPPLWRRLLRSKLLRAALVLLVLLVAGGLIVPQLTKPGGTSYIGDAKGKDKEALKSRAQPLPQGQNRQLFDEPTDGVHYIYELAASGREGDVANTACLAFDTDGSQQRFAKDFGARDCVATIRAIAGEVQDAAAYANPTIPQRAERRTGRTSVVSSCASTVSGGPRLGEFTLTQQADGKWVISGHRNEPSPCPKKPTGNAPSN